MSFRSWRGRMLLSQERVAEMSGLSLRTIQRLEAGERVSYASLRALAVTFDMDVDLFERELYAVNNLTDDFEEIPRWIRRLQPRWYGGPRLRRRDVLVVEIFCIACAVIAISASFFVPGDAQGLVASISAIPLFGCYVAAVSIRTADRYKLWPGAKNAPKENPRNLRTKTAEYALLFSVGMLSVALILWLAV